MSVIGRLVSRLVPDATGRNVINIPTIEIFFQRSPAPAEGTPRGIENLTYDIMLLGAAIRSGRTGPDGLITVPMIAPQMVLNLTHAGTPVAEYQLELSNAAFEGDRTVTGIQRRLRALGYHLGHDGADQDGIDASVGRATDKAILDFQIDNRLAFDGQVGRRTRTALNDQVGGSA